MLSVLFLQATGMASASASEAPILLVHGDSLSAAYGIPVKDGWVALLEQRLQQQAQPWRVLNSSISGETSAGGLARLPGLLERQQPAALILALGANDGLRGLPPEHLAGNLNAMIDAAQASGVRVLLVGVRLPPNYGPAYGDAFQAVYREVAKAQEVTYVESLLAPLEDDREAFLADQLHPTAEAQPRLLEALWPAIDAMLAED
jgi:acyl-CoA thioesterase-1